MPALLPRRAPPATSRGRPTGCGARAAWPTPVSFSPKSGSPSRARAQTPRNPHHGVRARGRRAQAPRRRLIVRAGARRAGATSPRLHTRLLPAFWGGLPRRNPKRARSGIHQPTDNSPRARAARLPPRYSPPPTSPLRGYKHHQLPRARAPAGPRLAPRSSRGRAGKKKGGPRRPSPRTQRPTYARPRLASPPRDAVHAPARAATRENAARPEGSERAALHRLTAQEWKRKPAPAQAPRRDRAPRPTRQRSHHQRRKPQLAKRLRSRPTPHKRNTQPRVRLSAGAPNPKVRTRARLLPKEHGHPRARRRPLTHRAHAPTHPTSRTSPSSSSESCASALWSRMQRWSRRTTAVIAAIS